MFLSQELTLERSSLGSKFYKHTFLIVNLEPMIKPYSGPIQLYFIVEL